MKVTNDTGLELTWLQADTNFPEPFATFVIKGTYDIVPDGVCTQAATQRPISDDQRHMDGIGRSLSWASDLAPFKPNSDFLILGTFHQPGGIARPTGQAGFSFGPLRKDVAVFGPRMTVRPPGGRPVMTAPEPFTSLPLRWEYSAGGLRYPGNPMGLGGDVRTLESGERVRTMPRIENPDHLIRMAADRPQPVNFAPVPPFFRFRRQKLGTRDQRWSLFRAPLPPEDFDPSYYNAAPPDQQGGNCPRGDETLVLRNMHPKYPELRTRLPGVLARLAVLRRTAEQVTAEAVAMELDTVVAIPDEEQIVLVWRGRCPVSHRRNMSELFWVGAEMEPLAGPAASPRLPDRLMRAYQDGLDAEVAAAKAKADDEAAEAAALDDHIATTLASIRKLLGQAKLPPDLARIVAVENDPATLYEHLKKFVEDGLAELHRRYPHALDEAGP
ncbi:MAG: DUF2169 domain-containing protein [Acetobacteraceae bacterium]